MIRRRLRAYDDVAPSPTLGNYGEPDNREWKQYFLPDRDDAQDPDDGAARCPFGHVAPPGGRRG